MWIDVDGFPKGRLTVLDESLCGLHFRCVVFHLLPIRPFTHVVRVGWTALTLVNL